MSLIAETHLVLHPSENIIFDYAEIQSNFSGNDFYREYRGFDIRVLLQHRRF